MVYVVATLLLPAITAYTCTCTCVSDLYCHSNFVTIVKYMYIYIHVHVYVYNYVLHSLVLLQGICSALPLLHF